MTFSKKVLEYAFPGAKILDLGAGDGWFSRKCLEKQAMVTAVDRKLSPDQHPEIDWHQMDVQAYVERLQEKDMFDIVYSRNLIQFLEGDWVENKLIPILVNHLRPGGIIAIQTFYRDPEPPFERAVSSLWAVKDLQRLLPKLQVLQKGEISDMSPDMRGIPRRFFLTNLIAKKSS